MKHTDKNDEDVTGEFGGFFLTSFSSVTCRYVLLEKCPLIIIMVRNPLPVKHGHFRCYGYSGILKFAQLRVEHCKAAP